ncbi:MAG: M14 family zinc carboxypeptidase [Gammaproteobacteria bacterium]|nr:M14 family zinc carboxypeptidase [Gammaproteobacteria bacterium]
MKTVVYVSLSVALSLIASTSMAQFDVRDADNNMYPADVRYDPDIPTPESVLGHEFGDEPVRHHKLIEYITRVAALSDRLSLEVIGYSHERRPILFVVATSPENHAHLNEIRTNHVALTEPSFEQPVTDDMPVVTWINYGVHGAESSGMDASLPFIYHLAAAQGDGIENILGNSVVLVTAIFNPDGHSKRVAWFDAYGGQREIRDPAHIEHQYNWQFARTNHYWFDLNRQWLLLTQPEPRAWMRKWHEWRPNLTVDYHEMGSDQTYYFHPGAATRTNPLVPNEAERLMQATVKASEDFLDAEGRLYFHGERFDNYYIGKGSTYPLINGGVGILYEAAAALGRELETDNGLRTYRENIRKHFRTSIASIEGASNLRVDYLNYQKDFYESAIAEASRYPTKAWIFTAPSDPMRMNLFVDVLKYHRIITYRLSRDVDVAGKTFRAADALIVPTTQTQHRLIRSIFEAVTEFEDATFYDVSTWTMPPAFGLQYAALAGRDFRSNLVGELFVPAMPDATNADESNYGYVFEWSPYLAPRALQHVLENELLARVAMKPFTAMTTQGTVEFGRGSIVVPFDRQKKDRVDIRQVMNTIAAEDGIVVHALTSGRSATGTAGIDLGGPSFRPLEMPKVLLVVGDDIDLYDAGEIWHLMDYRINMPVSLRSRDSLDDIDWSPYSHIVFPSGDYEEYEPEYADRLRQWVAEGGTAIGMRDAAPWLRMTTLDWVDPESDEALAEADSTDGEDEPDVDDPEKEEQEHERFSYSEKEDREAADVIGGAIFIADLDISHPLGFGYTEREIFLHKNTKEPFEPTDNPYSTVIAYSADPVFSGFVSDENREALAETPSLIAERSDDGSIILFADNTNFRGYWYGTNKLFLNALFFSKVFDAPAED